MPHSALPPKQACWFLWVQIWEISPWGKDIEENEEEKIYSCFSFLIFILYSHQLSNNNILVWEEDREVKLIR